MKNLLIILLVAIPFVSFAQTFKITQVETSKSYNYQRMNKELLGKNLIVTFNGNTITLNLSGKNQPITMKKLNYPENTYSFFSKQGSISETYTAKFNSTFGVFTSITFKYFKHSDADDETNTITAKRF